MIFWKKHTIFDKIVVPCLHYLTEINRMFITFLITLNHILSTILIFIMNIFISNINYSVKESQLEELFASYGAIQSAKIIMDRDWSFSWFWFC